MTNNNLILNFFHQCFNFVIVNIFFLIEFQFWKKFKIVSSDQSSAEIASEIQSIKRIGELFIFSYFLCIGIL